MKKIAGRAFCHGHIEHAERIAEGVAGRQRSRRKISEGAAIKARYAYCWVRRTRTDEAVNLLRTQLNGSESDRETYLNIAQIYERAAATTKLNSPPVPLRPLPARRATTK